jgi:hypothetical protein
VDGQITFWFVVTLTLLLLVFIGAVVWTHPGAVGSPQPHELNLPPPAPPSDLPLPVRVPSAVVLTVAVARSANAGHGPSRADALNPELIAARRPHAVGRPPWSPAPKPPDLVVRDAAQPLAVLGRVPQKPSAYRAPQPDVSVLPPRTTQMVQGRAASGGRAGAHRRGSRRGTHRAGRSGVRAAGSTGRAGRHRAGAGAALRPHADQDGSNHTDQPPGRP